MSQSATKILGRWASNAGSAPKYASVLNWCDITGMGRTNTYHALARGDLRAIKVGKKTLVDVDHGLAWLASMPRADIRVGQNKKVAA